MNMNKVPGPSQTPQVQPPIKQNLEENRLHIVPLLTEQRFQQVMREKTHIFQAILHGPTAQPLTLMFRPHPTHLRYQYIDLMFTNWDLRMTQIAVGKHTYYLLSEESGVFTLLHSNLIYRYLSEWVPEGGQALVYTPLTGAKGEGYSLVEEDKTQTTPSSPKAPHWLNQVTSDPPPVSTQAAVPINPASSFSKADRIKLGLPPN